MPSSKLIKPKVILASTLLLMASVGIAWTVFQPYQFSKLTPGEKLNYLWNKDLARIEVRNRFPKAWWKIRKVNLIPTTERTKSWMPFLKPQIPTSKDGIYDLEILIISWEDEEDDSEGAIVQYDLIHHPSQNLVWELGRTFELKSSTFVKKTKKKPGKTGLEK